MGASLGGVDAFRQVLKPLPARFPYPIALVLHRGQVNDDLLCRSLQGECSLPVAEALDKEPVTPGRICVAPSDYHLLVDGQFYGLSTGVPVNHSRPSIDVLFESAADAFGENVLAVLLTGNSTDGMRGAQRIKQRGGFIIVQKPESAYASAMPAAALSHADLILPLEEIGSFLAGLSTVSQTGTR